MDSSQRLTFCEPQAFVDIQFWQKLRHLKLREWGLSDQLVRIHGTLRANVGGEGGVNSSSMICFSQEAFDRVAGYRSEAPESKFINISVSGVLQNFNASTQLTQLNTKVTLAEVLFSELIAPLFCANHTSVQDEEEAWRVANYAPFAMFTHVDPKSYLFSHREAFPSFALDSPIRVTFSDTALQSGLISAETAGEIFEHGRQLLLEKTCSCNPFISVLGDGKRVRFRAFTPKNYSQVKEQGEVPVICFFDFSPVSKSASWAARNVILCLRLALPSTTSFSFLALRRGGAASIWYVRCACEPLDALAVRSILDTIKENYSGTGFHGRTTMLTNFLSFLKPTGWRTKGVSLVDLSGMMDPALRADADSRLNLELMRWRFLPSLELAPLAGCKVLLLGMGTLGCNVSRNLLTWGVRHLTLVDRGVVSFSNLARQSLFTISDATERRSKVEAAADALRSIIPTADVRSIVLTIPMPGHRTEQTKEAETRKEIEKLVQLIQEHDVVFLLTDSSEARWLPTVIAAAHNIPLINVALGFHQYVVMRHGISSSSVESGTVEPSCEVLPHVSHSSMGCYFCSSVVGPLDSVTGRELDEQCTVTRPGVSSIASAIAVELLAQIYQHPYRFRCSAYRTGCSDEAAHGFACLGAIPHQIRGDVYRYGVNFFYTERSLYCTACSEPILLAYRNSGINFLFRSINDPSFIEEVSGVRALKDQCGVELVDMEVITSGDDVLQ